MSPWFRPSSAFEVCEFYLMLNHPCSYCPIFLIVSPSGLLHVLVYLVWFFQAGVTNKVCCHGTIGFGHAECVRWFMTVGCSQNPLCRHSATAEMTILG